MHLLCLLMVFQQSPFNSLDTVYSTYWPRAAIASPTVHSQLTRVRSALFGPANASTPARCSQILLGRPPIDFTVTELGVDITQGARFTCTAPWLQDFRSASYLQSEKHHHASWPCPSHGHVVLASLRSRSHAQLITTKVCIVLADDKKWDGRGWETSNLFYMA